jgi:tetratricopeptide (TPR) repeat protein
MRINPVTTTLAALLACSTLAGFARADTVLQKSGESGSLSFNDCVITDFRDGRLFFNTGGGSKRETPAGDVLKLGLTRDPVFTAAEDAYAVGDWNKSIDGYMKIARGGEEWKRRWVVRRLLAAADQAKRFDAQVAAYGIQARLDPAAAGASRPLLAGQPAKALDAAVVSINGVLREATEPEAKAALLTFLVDLHRARNDAPAIASTLEQLMAASKDLSDEPGLRSLLAGVRLEQARALSEQKKFRELIALLESSGAVIESAPAQAESLYMIAQARAALARPDDKPAQQDAALAYLRVVAHFANVEGRPMVGESLLAAADIQQRVGDTESARQLLQQAVEEFADTPIGATATQRLKRLG